MVTEGEEVPEELYTQFCEMFEVDPSEGFGVDDLHATYTIYSPNVGSDITEDYWKIFGESTADE